MKEEYSVGRMSRRWRMRLFFSMLNIAGINNLMLRRQCFKEIAMDLYMTRRFSIMTLNTPLRNQIARFVPTEQASSSIKEGICSICPSKNKIKIGERKKGVADALNYCAMNIAHTYVQTVLLKNMK